MSSPMADRLSAPFAIHHTDPRGLTYISGQQVVERLNDVLGTGGWSFEIKEHGFDTESDEVWVIGHLEAVIDGQGVVREQAGSQKHNRRRADKTIVDYGFDLKGAGTDALKKCASLLGVGLYLSERDGGTLNPDADTFQCATCKTNLVTPEGDLITSEQAAQLMTRFGALLCRDHRPVKVLSNAQ